jgi:molecular chaperone DnaK
VLEESGQAIVIPNAEGSFTTPSIVAFTEAGDRLVGQIAKRQSATNPEHTVYAVKRLMGRKLADAEVTRHRRTCPYAVVEAENGDAHVKVRRRTYSPAEISSMVLAKMKEIATSYLGEEVTEAVVTVPAYFDDAQRQATKDAGTIAGLNVLRIVNEPTAAALAYGAARQKHERVVVYDLGGGTFDVSILELQGGVFEVKSTSGDTFLGGEDFDGRILNLLADDFQKEHRIDLRREKMALQRLREAAEKAKHELSTSLTTEVNLPFIAADASGPKHLQRTLRRVELEKLCEDLIQATLKPCAQALKDAHLGVGDIDQVILVGGQTRMPRVQQVVEEFFGKKPNKSVNPDEVVAMGAALQAGVLKGEIEEVLLLDVTPLSLGVETAGGVATSIIPRNTTIPTRGRKVFSTATDNQSFVNVHVLQGERPMAADNRSMARFELLGILPAPRGVPQIEVAFDLDANGIVNVSAKDLGTGRAQTVRVTPTSGLTREAIDRLIAEAESQREGDAQRKALAEARNEGEGLLIATERSLTEYGAGLEREARAEVDAQLAAMRAALLGTDPAMIKDSYKRLEQAAFKIAEAVYAQTPSGEGGSSGASGAG